MKKTAKTDKTRLIVYLVLLFLAIGALVAAFIIRERDMNKTEELLRLQKQNIEFEREMMEKKASQ